MGCRRWGGSPGADAVDTAHHLIVTHEVTHVGTERSQLAHVAKETKAKLEATSLDDVANRGNFNREEILAGVETISRSRCRR